MLESILRSECNYTGTQPYRDWILENPSANGSLFDSQIIRSFRGNGSEPLGCVQDGPFTDSAFLNIGPAESFHKNARCLTRVITEDTFVEGSNWEDIYPPLISRKNHYQVQQFIYGLSFVTDADRVATGSFVNPHSLIRSAFGGDVCLRYIR